MLAQLAFAVSGVVAVGNAAPVLRFRRTNDAFSTDRAQHGQLHEIGENVTVRFPLRSSAGIDFIELEIPAIPGCYRVERLVLQGETVPDLARRVINVRDRLLDGAAQHEIRYLSHACRPCIEIDVRDLLALSASGNEALFVDVVIRREDAVAEIGNALAVRMENLSGQLHRQSRELGEIAFGHGQELRRQSVRQDVQERHSTMIVESIQEASSKLDTLREQIQAQLHVQSQGVTAAQERVQEQLRQMAGQAQTHNANLSRDLAMTQQCLHEVQDQLTRLRLALENVFWRRWLRRLRRSRK